MNRQLIIRKAEERDILAIADLEKACFPHDPWSEESIRNEICGNPMALYIVAEEIETDDSVEVSDDVKGVLVGAIDGETDSDFRHEDGSGQTTKTERSHGTIAGYMGVWAVLDEGHIMNVAVNPDFRRRHIGEALISCMLEVTGANGVHSWTLEVRSDNEPAKALYRKMGFVEAGIRKGYYEYDNTDAIIMWRTEQEV